MRKEERLKRKQYLKTCKKYRKQVKRLCKEYAPYDYFVGDLLNIQIDHWIEYYSLGYNVWALERDDMPTRLEIATTLRKLYDNYKNFRYTDYEDWDIAQQEEEKVKRELFEYLFKYLEYMWD